MKRTMKLALLLSALLVGATYAAGASNPKVVRLPKGAVQVMTSPPHGPTTPYVEDSSRDSLIFGNLATKDPKGVYSVFQSFIVAGSNSVMGTEAWAAAAFTPTTNATVTKVEVAVGYASSTNDFDIFLSLNADNNGAPGKALKRWKITFHDGQPALGTCCTVESKKGSISVSANTQYWVVLSAKPDSDIWAGWSLNDSDQIDTALIGQYFGQEWSIYPYSLPAFAVYGH